MKKKKQTNHKKTTASMKFQSLCNHCGGALKYSHDYISCLMCGRNAEHYCDNCIVAQDLARKRA